MQEKVEGWAESVRTLAGVDRKHPQSAYAGLQKSLQQEWAFVQRVKPGISNSFGPVEEEITKALLPALFEGVGDRAPGREITRLSIKQAGTSVPIHLVGRSPMRCCHGVRRAELSSSSRRNHGK